MRKKSIIAVLCATVLCMVTGLLLVFTVGPKTSAADNEVELSAWGEFDISDGVLKGFSASGISKIGNSNFKISIPEEVIKIADFARYDASPFNAYADKITALTFPSTLQRIGDYAFYFNTNTLTSVDFSHATNLTEIGHNAMNGWYGISELDLSQTNLTVLGDGAFDFNNLTKIIFPSSLTTIGNFAFAPCNVMTQFDLSSCTNLSVIGNYFMSGTDSLRIVELPANLTHVGTQPFDDSSKLSAIIAPKNVIDKYRDLLSTCKYLHKLTYATGVQINLTNQNNESSVQIEKTLADFRDWHYVDGQWVQDDDEYQYQPKLPTLPDGWVWQDDNGEELTTERLQELLAQATDITEINATAVNTATDPDDPNQGGGDNNGGDTDPSNPTNPDDPNQGGNSSGDGNGGDQPTDPVNPEDTINNGDSNATNEPQAMEVWEQATYIGLGVASVLLLAVFGFCMTKIAILEHAYRKLVKQAIKK